MKIQALVLVLALVSTEDKNHRLYTYVCTKLAKSSFITEYCVFVCEREKVRKSELSMTYQAMAHSREFTVLICRYTHNTLKSLFFTINEHVEIQKKTIASDL